MTVPVPESLGGLPTPAVIVWLLAAAGWGAILAGLRRGVRGRARGPVLFAHTLTPPGLVLTFAVLGFGSLYALIAAAAEWWALALVTGFRPERLVQTGGLPRLAAWLALTGAATFTATRLLV